MNQTNTKYTFTVGHGHRLALIDSGSLDYCTFRLYIWTKSLKLQIISTNTFCDIDNGRLKTAKANLKEKSVLVVC